jgi:hypothetical protein
VARKLREARCCRAVECHVEDPSCVSVERGWCRLVGLPAMTLMLACLVVVRNLRVIDSLAAKRAEHRTSAPAAHQPRGARRLDASTTLTSAHPAVRHSSTSRACWCGKPGGGSVPIAVTGTGEDDVETSVMTSGWAVGTRIRMA